MKFIVLAVGSRMPAWIDAGFEEYARRMPRAARVELRELKPEKRTGASRERIMEAEAARIAAALPEGCEIVVLDERGKALTTAELAAQVARWQEGGRDVAWIIGGADGLHPELKRRASRMVSLSAFTLPHGLARVLLAEQLYRAVSLLAGHPYHRE
ncbi:MAG TPA: 23S rRNA (pseudouridine(1915)-N(3))-methyltransferase RlmH [Burkholderiales bacterium]|nr:23S rRNA (pseudouridine(1915)-N(3))-methyltransferase RlmH [Burkholderiales bacterium]